MTSLDEIDRVVRTTLFSELADALRNDGARLSISLPVKHEYLQIVDGMLLATIADRLDAGLGTPQIRPTQTGEQPVDDGRELAGNALALWFGYSWDGLYDRRIADRGYRPWTFDGLGHKTFQGGKLDVLDMIDRIVALAAPTSPGGLLAPIREALAPFAEIAEAYDEHEDDSFRIFADCDQRPISELSLGACRKAQAALKSSYSRAGQPTMTAEAAELLDRADQYLTTIRNKGDCGPHHLVSDLAATLRRLVVDGQASSRARQTICATPPDDLLRLADLLDKARNDYADKFGSTEQSSAKDALLKLLWDDKGTFAPALRLAAVLSTLLRDLDGAKEMRDCIVSIATSLNAPEQPETGFIQGWEAFREELLRTLGDDRLVELMAGRKGSDRKTVPDRDMLVTALTLAMARDDVEPHAAATLDLYRKDAEFIADGLARCGFALQLATERWRHKVRGSSYAEIGRAHAQSAIPIREGDTVVVYVADADGSMHVRKDAEFDDGRFERIAFHDTGKQP